MPIIENKFEKIFLIKVAFKDRLLLKFNIKLYFYPYKMVKRKGLNIEEGILTFSSNLSIL